MSNQVIIKSFFFFRLIDYIYLRIEQLILLDYSIFDHLSPEFTIDG